MKQSTAILALALFITSRTFAVAIEPPEVIDVFFKALQFQGRNPTLIRSGVISYEERSVRAKVSAKDKSASNARHVADLEKLIETAPSDIAREALQEELREARSPKPAGDQEAEAPAVLIRRDVFIGNNPRKRSRQEAAFSTEKNGLSSEQIIISEFTGVDTSFVSRMPALGLTSLRTNFFSIPSIEYCGRVRSPLAVTISSLILAEGGNHESFAFSPASIASMKETFETILNTPGLGVERVPHLVSTSAFEGSEVLHIEFGMQQAPAGVKIQTRLLRLTVDPSRGFIVPLEEEYHEGKLVYRFESSDYRQVGKDGVWFPWHSKEVHFNPATSDVVNETEWTITAASLNEEIDDGEFVIAIPAGEEIDDFRSNNMRGTTYRTEQPISLGAIASRDLTTIPGVVKPAVATGRHLPAGSPWSWGRRTAILATAGLLLVLIGLAIRRKQRR